MKLKEDLLGIAILIMTIFVTYYGINTIYPSPDYNNFCKGEIQYQNLSTPANCEAVGGKWNPNFYAEPVKTEPIGYCDSEYTCRQEYETANKIRSKSVFLIALPIGIVIVVLGAFFFGLEAVGAGLMGGGVGTLVYGSGAYWPYTENLFRFLISLVGLVVLIFFAYYFNKKFVKNKFSKNRKRK
jgi:hypothetical protein